MTGSSAASRFNCKGVTSRQGGVIYRLPGKAVPGRTHDIQRAQGAAVKRLLGNCTGDRARTRLYDLLTGALLGEWPDLDTGKQGSSIIRHIERPVPFALDRRGRRFAVGTGAGVTVISLGE